MSRILSLHYNHNIPSNLPVFFSFFSKNLIKHDFHRDVNCKNFLLRNIYFYYDFFFFALCMYFIKKNFFIINFVLFRNFKNFLNYFYNSIIFGCNFIVADNDYRTYSPFLYLSHSESFLIQYNAFLKKNHFFLKQQSSVILLKRFFYKTKTSTLVILNYDDFHKYIPMYSSFNAAIVSFVLPNTRFDLLDFVLFKSSKFFFLEKLLFLGKIYSVYSIALNVKNYNNYIFYKNSFKKIITYLPHI